MRKLFSSTHIRSILAWLIKLGTLGFNLPATLGVASMIVRLVTGTTDPFLTILLQVSGVVVVDTVFLASWYELDSNKTQDDSDKLADAITVVVMYIITIAIGVIHKEGWAGFLFRVPMGIAVARSTWKTISFSMRRTGDGTKGKNLPLRVRWEQMTALTARGVAIIRFELTNFLEDLKAQAEVMSKHRDAKKQAGIGVVVDMESIYREQAVASAKSNNVSMVNLPSLNTKLSAITVEHSSEQPTTNGNGGTKKNYSIHNEGSEWIATCLHPGCSVVKRGATQDTVRRQIVGHGNKHKHEEGTTVVTPEVIEDTTSDPKSPTESGVF